MDRKMDNNMEVKMDRRQQKTVNAINEAFCNLLKEKEYHKITVQEIIDAANVGRSTFYSHFETKDVLLTKICDDLFDHIFNTTFENHHDVKGYEQQRVVIEHILYHIKNDNQDIVGILISQSNSIFIHSFKEYFYEIIDQYLLFQNEPHQNIYLQNEIPTEILKNHIYCSFIGIVQIWINEKYKLPIEEISKFYLKMLPKIEL